MNLGDHPLLGQLITMLAFIQLQIDQNKQDQQLHGRSIIMLVFIQLQIDQQLHGQLIMV